MGTHNSSLLILTVLWFCEISFSLFSSYLSVTPSPFPMWGPLGQPLRWKRHSSTCLVALLGELFQAHILSHPKPAPPSSSCAETYVSTLFGPRLCMSPCEIFLFPSSLSAWAIHTFFWAPYLNYWHHSLANSSSQKGGSHCQCIPPLLCFLFGHQCLSILSL